MYLRISRRKKLKKTYTYYQLVESYRVGTTVNKRVICSIPAPFVSTFTSRFLHGRQPKLYALPTAIYSTLLHDLDLKDILTKVFTPARLKNMTIDIFLLASLMVIHRIIDPDSKLALTRWYRNIMLPVLLPAELDVHNFYYTLDYLLGKKEDIEKLLYQRLKAEGAIDATVMFYDLTSSYFEGMDVPMASYGYSRDHRPDCLQITLGLVIDKEGLPIYHEVFEGNMPDGKTVRGILEKLKKTFHFTNIIFVADKGMLTPDNLKGLEEKKYQSILSESVRDALSQSKREELFLQKDSFTRYPGMEKTLWYTTTLDKEGNNIIICYNPLTAAKAKQTRDAKLEKLKTFIRETKRKHAAKTGKKARQKVRDMVMAKLVTSHSRKYFNTKDADTRRAITDLTRLKQEVITREEHMDGMWIVRGNTKDLTTEQLIKTYKELKTIEASFRAIKNVVELRPIYHHKDDRVKGHVFICILAFLVTKILEKRTGQTIKMLREKYLSAVAIHPGEDESTSPLILGGADLLQAVQ